MNQDVRGSNRTSIPPASASLYKYEKCPIYTGPQMRLQITRFELYALEYAQGRLLRKLKILKQEGDFLKMGLCRSLSTNWKKKVASFADMFRETANKMRPRKLRATYEFFVKSIFRR